MLFTYMLSELEPRKIWLAGGLTIVALHKIANTADIVNPNFLRCLSPVFSGDVNTDDISARSLNPDAIKEFLRLYSSERLKGPGVPGGGDGILVSFIKVFITTEMKGTFSHEAQTAAAK